MSTPRSHLTPWHLVPALLLMVTASCSKHNPVKPLGSESSAGRSWSAEAAGFGSGSFYPLTVGNAWTYVGEGSLRPLQDGVPGEPILTYGHTEAHRLTGTTTRDGMTYVVREEVYRDIPETEGDPFTMETLIRQDASGLYFYEPPFEGSEMQATAPAMADRRGLQIEMAVSNQPAAVQRLARRLDDVRRVLRDSHRGSSASDNEITELVYPLRIGESWSIRSDFPWPTEVDGVENLDTPTGKITAYRLATDPFGTTVHEGEAIWLFWSREGFVGYSIHLLEEGNDEDGNPTGEMFVADESMMVTSIWIER